MTRETAGTILAVILVSLAAAGLVLFVLEYGLAL